MRNEKKFNSMEIRIQISFSPEMENQKRIQLNWVASNWWFGCLSLNNISSISSILSTSFTTRKNSHCYLNINWLRVYIAFNGMIQPLKLFSQEWTTWNWKSKLRANDSHSHTNTYTQAYSICCHIAFMLELQETIYILLMLSVRVRVECVWGRKAQSTPHLIITRRYRVTFIKKGF